MINEEFDLLKSISVTILNKIRFRVLGLNCCNFIKHSLHELDISCSHFSLSIGKAFNLKLENKIVLLLLIADALSCKEKLFHDCSSLLTLEVAVCGSNNTFIQRFFNEYSRLKREKEENFVRNVYLSVFKKNLNAKYINSDVFNLIKFFFIVLENSKTFRLHHEIYKKIHFFILNISNDSFCDDIMKKSCMEYENFMKN